MNTSVKKLLKTILPLTLGVVLVWYSLSNISIAKLLVYFKNADYSWVFLGVFFGFLSHLSRAYRWKFLLEPLGHKPKLHNSIMAVFLGYLINYTIPRAGEVSRATVLTNYEKVPFEKSFGTIVSERFADIAVMMSIIGVTLILEFDFIFKLLSDKFKPSKIIIASLVIIILAFLIFIFLRKSQSKFALRIKNFISGLFEGILSIFKMKNKWAFIFHTLFIWGMYLLMFYVTSFSVETLQPIPFSAILIGFITASFSIAATNGGIGSYPEAVVLAFLLFALPEEPSRAFGWIMWTSQTAVIIIFGGLSFILLPIFNRTK